LVASIISYSALIACVIIGIEVLSISQRVHDELRKQIDLLVAEELPQLAQALWDYNQEAANLILHGIMENPYVARVELKDEQGSTIATLDRARGESLPRGAPTAFPGQGLEQSYLILFTPRGKPPRSLGSLSLWPSLEVERGRVRELLAMAIGLAITIVVMLVIVIKLTIERILGRPLRKIAGRLSSIETVEPGRPVLLPEQDTHEELLVIANAINEMGTRIGESERRFRSLFEDSPISIWDEDLTAVKAIVDEAAASGVRDWPGYFEPLGRVRACLSAMRVRDVNKATLLLLGFPGKEDLLANLAGIFSAESYEAMRAELAALASGQVSYEGDSVHVNAKGERLFVRISLKIVPGYEGTWSRVLVSVMDLSERRKIEEALERSEAKYRGLVEQSLEGIMLLDRTGTLLDCNAVTVAFMRKDKVTLLGAKIWDLAFGLSPVREGSPIGYDQLQAFWEKAIDDCIAGMPAAPAESSMRGLDDTSTTIEQILFPIHAGLGVMVGAIFRDVTAQRAASRALMESLREKEVLLQEVHHRVKNNLQIICSLIHLEGSSIDESSPIAGSLADMEARVSAMALVHDLLYLSDDLVHVDFASYVRQLVAQLASAYVDDRERIELRLSIGDVHLSLEKAIPCGLLINELVANSLKHAFPSGRKGAIRVSMTREDRAVSLMVADDGVGAPEAAIASPARNTIGLKLVEALASQLQGEYEIDGRNGFAVRLRFPD
jgi:two-component sensor histidine kinase/PAS domain-containing protein